MWTFQKVRRTGLFCQTKCYLVCGVSMLVMYPLLSHAGRAFNEKNLDKVCVENIAKFRRKDTGQRNQSSLSHLLATFFEKVIENIVYYVDQFIRVPIYLNLKFTFVQIWQVQYSLKAHVLLSVLQPFTAIF
jgi:hypothetical protein